MVRSFVIHCSSGGSEGIHTTIVVSAVSVYCQQHAKSIEEPADCRRHTAIVKMNGQRCVLDMVDDEMVSVTHAINIKIDNGSSAIAIPEPSTMHHHCHSIHDGTTVGHPLLQDICWRIAHGFDPRWLSKVTRRLARPCPIGQIVDLLRREDFVRIWHRVVSYLAGWVNACCFG
jgi:hypothetical protein